MLEALNFVKGAVAKKDFVPSLTHFRIESGFIRGYNGALGLCSPIDLDLDLSPKAEPFIKAIMACKDTVAMHLTKSGRLSIKSGAFKAFVECSELTYPDIKPEGDIIALNGDFLPALRVLGKFMGEDASRPWACGVLFNEKRAYATNNIIIASYLLKYKFPVRVNVPRAAIKEILRIKVEPSSIQVSNNSITFHYEDGRWLRSALLDVKWPDVSKILNAEKTLKEIPEGLFAAIETVLPFLDEQSRIFFTEEGITTSLDKDIGAAVKINSLPKACFGAKPLLLLNDSITKIDFTAYPKPCLFKGPRLRGAIIGMHQ